MAEIKKKTEKNIGNELLELVNEAEGSLLEKEVQNTSLTLPEFEDQDVQRGWEKMANSPFETKVSPFIGIAGEIAQSELKKVNEVKPVTTQPQHVDMQLQKNKVDKQSAEIGKKKNEPIEKELLKNNGERLPISNVETVAITVLQKSEALVGIKSEVYNVLPPPPQSAPPKKEPEKVNLNTPSSATAMPNSGQKISQIAGNEVGSMVQGIREIKGNSVDQIRIAQNRISQLEKEIETLKWDNEKLGYAAQLLQKKCDELSFQKEKMEGNFESFEVKLSEENKLLKSKLDKKRDENKELKIKNQDLESRLAQDVRRSSGRERELENRLELIKMEKISLVASKDEIILNLKRQIDQLQFEVESYRRKTSELQKAIDSNEEQIRRTVRALRLALTNLELSEESKVSKQGE